MGVLIFLIAVVRLLMTLSLDTFPEITDPKTNVTLLSLVLELFVLSLD